MQRRVLSAIIILMLVLQPALLECETATASRFSVKCVSFDVEATPAVIQDFYVNNTQTGNTTQFAFNVSDNIALQSATFSNDNGTGTWANQTLSLSGTSAYANFTVNAFSASTMLNFTFWIWNKNSWIAPTTIGYRTLAIYNSSMPFLSLGNAITAVEGANDWATGTSGVNCVYPYEGLILDMNTTSQYESVIDSLVGIPPLEDYFQGDAIIPTFGSYTWGNTGKEYDNNTNTAANTTLSAANTSSYGLEDTPSITILPPNYVQYLIGSNNATQQPYVSMVIQVYCPYPGVTSWFTIFNGNPTFGSPCNVSITGTPLADGIDEVMYSFSYTQGNPIMIYLNETQMFSGAAINYNQALEYMAYIQKMNLTWSNKQKDITSCLGNISMLGGSCPNLPYTDSSSGYSDFGIEDTWVLYGYYYAAQYSTCQSTWNITPAYTQFDTAVNYSVSHNSKVTGNQGLPFWIFSDGTGGTYTNRYYDEDSETIMDYLVFYYMLNVTDALNKAQYWWNYLVSTHWSSNATYGGYFKYWPTSNDPAFECSAAFLLKIMSIMKYYAPNMANYSLVLQDVGNRFLSQEWNSPQWLTYSYNWQTGSIPIIANSTAYAVVHEFVGNPQIRMEETLATWEALLGAYENFNTTYENNMKDMLAGNTTTSTQPAWSLLMSRVAGLWDPTSKLFRGANNVGVSAEYTAWGERTLFLMGIIPQTTTIGFPLEELGYAYIYDVNPVTMSFNSTAKQITIPVIKAGTMTFQYGQSPITYTFNESGVYTISFTSSWNMISSVTVNPSLSVLVSPTHTNVSVGQPQLFTSNVSGGNGPYSYQWYLDGVPVSGATNATWTFTPTSTGSYTVCVRVADNLGTVAISTSATVSVTVPTISVLNPGPESYPSGWNASDLAVYVGTPDFVFYSKETSSGSTFFINVTVSNVTNLCGWGIGIVYDNTTLQYVTAWLPTDNVFAGAAAVGASVVAPSPVTVPVDAAHEEVEYGASYTPTTPIWDFNGTGTLAQLEFQIIAQVNSTNPQASSSFTFDPAWTSVYFWPSGSEVPTLTTGNFVYEVPTHDVAVTDVAFSKTVVGQGYGANVTVTAADLGDYTETFNVTVYANATDVTSQNVTLSSGNYVSFTFTWNTIGFAYGNYTLSAYAWPVSGEMNTASNNCTGGNAVVSIPGDVDGNGIVNVGDVISILLAFGSTLGQSRYIPNCDIDGNGRIDMGDVMIALYNFGKHYP